MFMALKNRTCYGTTHVNRMYLDFTINGYPVGGDYRSELDQIGIFTVNNISVFAASDYAYNISRIEIGKHKPSLDTLEKIADVIDIPVGILLVNSCFYKKEYKEWVKQYRELIK